MLDLLRTYSDRIEFDGLIENVAKTTKDILFRQNKLGTTESFNNSVLRDIPHDDKNVKSNSENFVQTNNVLLRINIVINVVIFLSGLIILG